MSILGAMYAAVSGLNANSNALGIISDNIANANTVGYKDTCTDFLTLVTQSGIASRIFAGRRADPADLQHRATGRDSGRESRRPISRSPAAASSSSTAIPPALAATARSPITRAGNFSVDANGNLVNAAGLYLQGQVLTAAQSPGDPERQVRQTSAATTSSALQTINVNEHQRHGQPDQRMSPSPPICRPTPSRRPRP